MLAFGIGGIAMAAKRQPEPRNRAWKPSAKAHFWELGGGGSQRQGGTLKTSIHAHFRCWGHSDGGQTTARTRNRAQRLVSRNWGVVTARDRAEPRKRAFVLVFGVGGIAMAAERQPEPRNRARRLVFGNWGGVAARDRAEP